MNVTITALDLCIVQRIIKHDGTQWKICFFREPVVGTQFQKYQWTHSTLQSTSKLSVAFLQTCKLSD